MKILIQTVSKGVADTYNHPRKFQTTPHKHVTRCGWPQTPLDPDLRRIFTKNPNFQYFQANLYENFYIDGVGGDTDTQNYLPTSQTTPHMHVTLCGGPYNPYDLDLSNISKNGQQFLRISASFRPFYMILLIQTLSEGNIDTKNHLIKSQIIPQGRKPRWTRN